ncbi:putative collagen alpha [Sesbania bispinosa]|nr:putative collagen alpha [Sesbania bispinosa]
MACQWPEDDGTGYWFINKKWNVLVCDGDSRRRWLGSGGGIHRFDFNRGIMQDEFEQGHHAVGQQWSFSLPRLSISRCLNRPSPPRPSPALLLVSAPRHF